MQARVWQTGPSQLMHMVAQAGPFLAPASVSPPVGHGALASAVHQHLCSLTVLLACVLCRSRARARPGGVPAWADCPSPKAPSTQSPE